jgi:hemerythrin-like metal-binding protein
MTPEARGYQLHTGYAPIDAEHKRVTDLLERFVSGVHECGASGGPEGDALSALDALMSELAERVVEHFAHEATWMDRIGYADGDGHKAAHVALVRDVEAHQLMLRKEGLSPVFEKWVDDSLVPWFRHHIQQYDVALSRAILEYQRSGAAGGPSPNRPGLPA